MASSRGLVSASRERGQHPDDPGQQHRQQRLAVVLGGERRQLRGRQRDSVRCPDPQQVGRLHEQVRDPERGADADDHRQGHQELVQAGIEADQYVHTTTERVGRAAAAPAHRRLKLDG